eukprot:TRINITY_DN913_c0_g1_i1.p1 TRINITY_DN913_c0_g1~~TRINITY_DN913_c0_g1_i1.p1  ORF type:complete len:559 (+),score=105.22 TRINITY_DN913_c0_g1_i1:176-1678(+)
MYQNWDRVMLLLTGDSHMHGNLLDFFWCCCKCGDLCNGEATRYLTACSCCPKRIRNTNLVEAFGRCIGFASHSVELRNITVGDLPFSGRGDFYLTVECKNNPNQVTSLAERKEPYVVYFPETLTLRMRYSPLEEKVKIKVYELNLLGAEELCSLSLSAMNVLEWRHDEHPSNLKRFEMKPKDMMLEMETQPWILLEFGEPIEARDLEHMQVNAHYIRTATAPGSAEPYQERPMKEFKDDFVLRDAAGKPVREMDEEELSKLKYARSFLSCQMWFFNTLVVVALAIYAPWRTYIWSCWTQFEGITMAKMNHVSFPISSHDLHKLEKHCHQELDGTGIHSGVPCRPSGEQILETCHSATMFGPPPKQPWPGAGKVLAKNLFDLDIAGVHCASPAIDANGNYVDMWGSANATYTGILAPVYEAFDEVTEGLRQLFLNRGGVCEIRQEIHPYDPYMVLAAIAMVLSTFIVRWFGNWALHKYKLRLLSNHEEDERDLKKIRATRR